jgi:predicted PhzF superfamily epimerase YddE/YHI9
VTEWLAGEQKDVVILCSGWKNKFCLEDTLFAGALTRRLLDTGLFRSDCDSAMASMDLWDLAEGDVLQNQWVDNGPGWVAVMLASAEAVLAVSPSLPSGDSERLDIGIVGAYPPGAPCAYEVRAIFSNDRGELVEDPVTGSLNASLAQWLVGSGRFEPPYLASQGTLLGRTGRPAISRDPAGSIWVGGATHTVVEGELRLVGQATVTTTE